MSKPEFNFEDITFGKNVSNLCLESYIKSISDYNAKLSTALTSNHNLPIFLDTNVLLRYYETSLKYRDKLLKFFSDRIEQIVLTHEVQKEFVRNREDTIDRFISQSLGGFKKDYETKFVKGFSSYLNDIKNHLDDFPEIGESINEIQSKVKDTYGRLDEKISTIEGNLKELKQKDDYLNLFSKVKMLDCLKTENIKQLKEQFEYLGKQLDEAKKDRENKIASIFPGYLDKKRKGKNPYGDFIIFHEILSYIKENNTDAVLLTFDGKGDWIKENREAHSHYIQIAYEATGHHIFIIDAEDYFQTNLQTKFESFTDDISLIPSNDEPPPDSFGRLTSEFIDNINELLRITEEEDYRNESIVDKIHILGANFTLDDKIFSESLFTMQTLKNVLLGKDYKITSEVLGRISKLNIALSIIIFNLKIKKMQS